MIDVADHYLGPDAVDDKVFFVDSYRHTQTDKSLTSTKSVGTTLSQWLTAMVNDLPWQNQRPDLTVVAGRFWTPRAQAPLLTGLDDLLRLHGNLKDLHFAESTLQEDEADESSGFGP